MLNRRMTEAKKKDNEYYAVPNAAGRRALRPVLLHYAIAQDGADGLKLLHVPLGLDEEALVVFSSWETAQRYYVLEDISFLRFSVRSVMHEHALPARWSHCSSDLTKALSGYC